MNLIQILFGSRSRALNKPDVMQRSYLLAEMRNIQKSYEERGAYCYELYTLMCAVAIKEKIPYDMDIHSELMN